MAAIDKICEYSGDYKPSLMWKSKHNSIQVLPQYKPLFKSKRAALIWFAEPTLVSYCGDGPHAFFSLPFTSITLPALWRRDYWAWRKWGNFYTKATLTWDYCLYVPDLPGKVGGLYMNYTTDPPKTMRNLCRLVGSLIWDSQWCTLPNFEESCSIRGQSWYEALKVLGDEMLQEIEETGDGL